MTMYYLAIVLPPHLNQKVLYWKNFMLEKYNCKVGLKSPAHITLIPPFWMEEEKENLFIKDVNSLSASLKVFSIKTNNFSAFKPRTIFIALEKNTLLEKTKETTDQFFKANPVYPVTIDTRPFHPHITIATRDLFKKSFHEAWPMFEKEKFEEEWEVFGLSILRHNKKNWDVIHTSQFQL